MKISEFTSTTEPVTIQRGTIKIVADCYLERINVGNTEYKALRLAELQAMQAEANAEAELQVLAHPEYLRMQIVPEGKTLTPRLMEKRTSEITSMIPKRQTERDAAVKELIKCRAERIAYLVRSWDLTEDDGAPYEVNTDNILRLFSVPMINLMIEKIEQAVFGPLV